MSNSATRYNYITVLLDALLRKARMNQLQLWSGSAVEFIITAP